MRIEFRAKTNKDYCMINTAKFHLKSGGVLTIDRKETEYSIEGNELQMTWIESYIWALNEETLFDDERYYPFQPDEKALCNLLRGSWVELELENDADSDYEVTDVEFEIYDWSTDTVVIGTGFPDTIDPKKLLEKVINNSLWNNQKLIKEMDSNGLEVWDTVEEYLMENFGTTKEEVENLGIELVA